MIHARIPVTAGGVQAERFARFEAPAGPVSLALTDSEVGVSSSADLMEVFRVIPKVVRGTAGCGWWHEDRSSRRHGSEALRGGN
jgi:hypothetical protein